VTDYELWRNRVGEFRFNGIQVVDPAKVIAQEAAAEYIGEHEVVVA